MSGRKGLGVKADDLFEVLLERSRAEIAKRRGEDGRGGAVAADRDARAIAVGALRYFLLKVGRTKVIAFDFDEALNFEGDTGPYLQYSLVRTDNIFRKLEEKGLLGIAGTRARCRTRAGTTTSGRSPSTPRRRPDVAERAVESLELAASRGTPSASPRRSITSTTASRSSRKRTRPSGTAGSPSRVFSEERCRVCSSCWAFPSRGGCDARE